jgi:uncharacterized membrane protein YdjX (TVP38/TMEM64 family)
MDVVMPVVRRFWPLLLLLAAAAAAWAGGLTQQIGWPALARNQAVLVTWVASHPIIAPSLYMLIYAGAVLLSLPEAAVITVAAGLLFGTWLGGILAVLGSSAGAIALFLLVRYNLADAIVGRRGRFLDAVRRGLRRDGFSYLLAIRLVPAFPFWLVNLAAALSGMRLLPYVAATVLGVMPATFVYASIGAGLGDVLSAGGTPDLAVIFSPRILGPLIGLAALSLLPIAWRRWKRSGA